MSNQVQRAFEVLIGKLIHHERAALDCALEVAAVREALQHSESEPTEQIDPVAEMWKTDIY